MHCWNVAQKDSALRYSLNTRMTQEAAYNRYRHELENIGIDSVSAFRRIIHSTHSLERHLQNPANSGGAASPMPAIRHHTGMGSVPDARDSSPYGQRGRCPSRVLQVPLESAQRRKYLEEQRDGTKISPTSRLLRYLPQPCEDRGSGKESAYKV